MEKKHVVKLTKRQRDLASSLDSRTIARAGGCPSDRGSEEPRTGTVRTGRSARGQSTGRSYRPSLRPQRRADRSLEFSMV